MTSLAFVLGCIFMFALGWLYRDLRDSVIELRNNMKKEPEAPLGATLGSYGNVNEFARTNQATEVGLVESKTPQRVEYEAQEALRREARGQ